VTDNLPEVSDAVSLAESQLLSADEARYVAAARSANTLRGYRSDWAEWERWAAQEARQPLPADPAAISAYLTFLAGHGAKVGTMARRLSALRFAHRLRDLPYPTDHARVVAVWEGIRRTHGAPAEQAAPLMPPELLDVLDACPTTRTWRTANRPPEPDLAGARDRALLLLGFVAALRRSELAALHTDCVAEHLNGLIIAIRRSKTNQTGEVEELAVLPRSGNAARCPVGALQGWLDLASITSGPLLQGVTKPECTDRVRPIGRAGLKPVMEGVGCPNGWACLCGAGSGP